MKRFLNLICAFILLVCCSTMTACSNSIVGTYELVGIRYWDHNNDGYEYQVNDGIEGLEGYFEELNENGLYEETLWIRFGEFEIHKTWNITKESLTLEINSDGSAYLYFFKSPINNHGLGGAWIYDNDTIKVIYNEHVFAFCKPFYEETYSLTIEDFTFYVKKTN